jgi:hypothetical protein
LRETKRHVFQEFPREFWAERERRRTARGGAQFPRRRGGMHPETGTALNVVCTTKKWPYSTDLESHTFVFGYTEIKAATTSISRQCVGIYCWKQVCIEEGHTAENMGTFIKVL